MKGLQAGAIGFVCWSVFANLIAWAQPVQKQITFAEIQRIAQEKVAKRFALAQVQLPEELRGDKLNYDTYREIRFHRNRALWAKEELPFRLEFFHPGYLYQTPVLIHEFTSSHYQPIRFVQDFFDYGRLRFTKKIPADIGYAGVKLLCHLNAGDRWDEFASFLGSSYFRCLGKGQAYGLSARGLALNSGEVDLPEEFPVFTAWWVGKPEKESNTIRLYALLESKHCTGAYDFLLRPGDTTVVDVEAALYFRADYTNAVRTLGLAPLTSMFWFGENSETKPDDYRPEVHDTDGLSIRYESGDFQWCPLANPAVLQHRTFPARNVRGFGLLQRDRAISNYQDLFNPYHKVPSAWVEPRGNWGDGKVHLVELPTRFEGADNIVAFWDPDARPAPMAPFRIAYTLHWASEPDAQYPVARVVQTRTGIDPGDANKRQFVIDFAVDSERPGNSPPEAQVECEKSVTVHDIQVFPNELSKGWRVFFSLKPDGDKSAPVDIRCSLKQEEKTVSEIWTYLWKPSQRNRK
jgi:periplasmic glucans biosynthesis protein